MAKTLDAHLRQWEDENLAYIPPEARGAISKVHAEFPAWLPTTDDIQLFISIVEGIRKPEEVAKLYIAAHKRWTI